MKTTFAAALASFQPTPAEARNGWVAGAVIGTAGALIVGLANAQSRTVYVRRECWRERPEVYNRFVNSAAIARCASAAEAISVQPHPAPRSSALGYLHFRCDRYVPRELVPAEGIEPPTFGLQNRCSTAELSRRLAFV